MHKNNPSKRGLLDRIVSDVVQAHTLVYIGICLGNIFRVLSDNTLIHVQA